MNGARLAGALALLCAAGVVAAVEIQVRNPWVRSAAQGQPATPAYVDLVSDTAVKLVGAASPWARKIELRAVEIKDGLPAERPTAVLDIPAGATVRLAPQGDYLALIDVTRAFGNGDLVPITLSFEDAARTPHTVEFLAQARGLLLPASAAPRPK